MKNYYTNQRAFGSFIRSVSQKNSKIKYSTADERRQAYEFHEHRLT